ncbi:hypothetical protein T484DRAFT_1784485, partial [Baffinella frigidus]
GVGSGSGRTSKAVTIAGCGEVVTGGDVVKRIEGGGSGSGRTSKVVTIAACDEVTKKTE